VTQGPDRTDSLSGGEPEVGISDRWFGYEVLEMPSTLLLGQRGVGPIKLLDLVISTR